MLQMRYSTIVTSALSLIATGIHAAEDPCNFVHLTEPVPLETNCNMFWVAENNAYRANCGYGTLDWAIGTDGQYGKVTTKSLRTEEILYFSWETLQGNGEARSYGFIVHPKATCTHDLPSRANITKVTAEFNSA
ncbi:hypothetical protein BUE80_DR012947 [Diplocarpon rosae]|nr:hypothetical protein BUE80_DR012947 [Diplocarpon rosae]